MTPTDTAWLAGLLEGEGCFSICWRDSLAGQYPSYSIKLAMTDADVVQRAHDLVGHGSLRLNKPRKEPNAKDISIWTLTPGFERREPFQQLLRDILPLMGARRSAKIREILGLMGEHPPRPRWRHGTRQGYEVGCRCRACKDKHAERHREMRRKRRENRATRRHKEALPA